jgi:hypothetical protein
MNRFIYLAGPIVDCTEGEAKDWRDYVCGTLFEIGWAIALRKMIVLVTDDLYLAAHPLIETNVSFIVPTLEEGVEIIKGLLPIYTGNSESVSKTPRKGHRGHINRLGTSYTQGEDGIFQDNRERK